MKKRVVYLTILLIGLFIAPSYALAVGEAPAATGAECSGQISLQHLNQRNDVGRYWNIGIGHGGNRTRAFCMDAGKKARTGETCKRQRKATPEEIRDIIKVDNSSDAHVTATAMDNIRISAGQGNLSDASIRMAMLSAGEDVYAANRASTQILNATATASSGGGYDVWICNGDANGDTWQRMLVPSGWNGCEVTPPEKESCPGGDMVMEGSIGKCTNSNKDGEGNTFEFTYSATGGSLHNVHSTYGEDLGAPVGKYCRVYCTEQGWATLPGALGEALQLGSYIVWPTSTKNFTSDKFQQDFYPLRFRGLLTCNLEIMTDLESEHANMPVGCKTDVVKTYEEYWKVIIQLKNQYDVYKDAARMTYEDIRHEFIGRTTNPPGVCKAYYHSGGIGCENFGKQRKYIIRGTQGDYASCYDLLQEGEAKEAKYLSELYAEYNALGCTEDETEPHCTTPSDPYEQPVCHDELTACARQKRALKVEIRHVESIIREINDRMQQIRSSWQTCTSYVNAYEVDARIHHQMHLCSKWTISPDDYDFDSYAEMNYSDETKEKKEKNLKYYNTGNVYRSDDLTEKNASSTSSFVSKDIDDGDNKPVDEFYPSAEFTSVINSLKDRVYQVEAKEYYELQTGYKYLDKDKLIYTKSQPEKNYIQIKTKKEEDGKISDNTTSGVIPTSYDNKEDEEYNLKITDITFGQAGFGGMDGSTYVCKQKFVKKPDRCICPENTLNAGKSLECSLSNNDMTCLDAISKYCEDSSYKEEIGCPLYCKNDPTMPLTPCLNAGLTVDQCNNSEYCNPYKCPNSEKINDPSMDEKLRDCVVTQMAQGVSKNKAIEMCEPLVCYGGRTIIYRTIKLENPFPSYNADETVTQSKLTNGMFNTTVKGRFPGSNWNSSKVVSEKIIHNRGASGTSIYQTREPLYTFVINGPIISKIRDYNDSIPAGYNDFNLLCKKNHAAACISEFVHGQSKAGDIGLVGGTCMNAKSKDEFYSCVNKKNKTE